MNTPRIANAAVLLSRILLSLMFIMAGAHKLTAYAGTVGYMEHMGVPSFLLPLVILTELGGGLLILLGYQTRIAAFLMAGFALVSGILFHLAIGDAANMVQFYKNVTIAGGFLALMVNGAGAWSIDGLKKPHA